MKHDGSDINVTSNAYLEVTKTDDHHIKLGLYLAGKQVGEPLVSNLQDGLAGGEVGNGGHVCAFFSGNVVYGFCVTPADAETGFFHAFWLVR